MKAILIQNRLIKLTQLKKLWNRPFRIKNKAALPWNSTIHSLLPNVSQILYTLIYGGFKFTNIVTEMKNLKVPKNVKSYQSLY